MAWVDFFRAFPPLVLLIFVCTPACRSPACELGGFACVAIAFFLNTGAYYGEILRAGIESVPRGQIEAARSHRAHGAADHALRRAAAGGAQRAARPALQHAGGGEAHLASRSVVACPSCCIQARQAQSVTYNADADRASRRSIYFLLLWPVVRLLSRLENRALAGRA